METAAEHYIFSRFDKIFLLFFLLMIPQVITNEVGPPAVSAVHLCFNLQVDGTDDSQPSVGV